VNIYLIIPAVVNRRLSGLFSKGQQLFSNNRYLLKRSIQYSRWLKRNNAEKGKRKKPGGQDRKEVDRTFCRKHKSGESNSLAKQSYHVGKQFSYNDPLKGMVNRQISVPLEGTSLHRTSL
jgi:hypothetical protein